MSDAEDLDLGADDGALDSSSHSDPQEMPVLSTVQLSTSELCTVHSLSFLWHDDLKFVVHHLWALKDNQLKYQSLFHRYKALQTKYNTLKSTKSVPMKKGHRLMLSGEDKESTLARGLFSFVFELWVDESILKCDCPSGMGTLNPEELLQ
jgi:hypothetical protein